MWRQTSKFANRQPRSVVARLEGTPRQQHQLMAATSTAEDHLRESRRVFLISLQEIMAAFPKVATAVKDTSAPRVVPKRKPASTLLQPRAENSNASRDVFAVSHKRNNGQLGKSDTNPEFSSDLKGTHGLKLREAIQNKDEVAAAALVGQALKGNFEPSPQIACQLFYLLVETDPILAYSVLRKGRKSDALNIVEFRMYLKLCSMVGSIELGSKERGDVKRFVTELIDDLLAMDNKFKQDLLPKIITGLVAQRNVRIGAYAKDLYRYMVNNNLELRPGWLKQLLSLSNYNRQDDLPFDDILERLAASDTIPHPLPVISAVHNMFPFTDSDKMCRTLKALLKFQERNVLKHFPMYSSVDGILIDLDCLESISAGAAQTGSIEMILLVWDVLMQCNYQPTESIYENTVIAFASGGEHLQSAFGAIVSMKDHGYEVPRSLLRSFSLALRSDEGILNTGMRILASSPELQTLETYNAIMSCYAERGDTRDVFAIFDKMLQKNIAPDCNSYSFAMEALGKNIHRRKQHHVAALVQQNLDDADRILGMMEENQILPSADFIRNYVELLCIAGESTTANLLVDDMLKQIPKSICSKTLYRLALTNAENGEFERAQQLASRITDDIPTLMAKIRSRQQRVRHLGRAVKSDG